MKTLPNGREVKDKHYSWRLKQQNTEKRIKEEFQQEVQRILSTWTGKMKACKECGDVLPACTPFFPKNGNSFRTLCGKGNKNCSITRNGGGGPQSTHSARMMDRVKRLHTLLNATKRKAKIEDREYDLDINWLLNEESKGCAWTGKPFSYDYEKGVKNIMSPSIDRMDSSRGYSKDNCQVVWMFVNLGLADAPHHIREQTKKLLGL